MEGLFNTLLGVVHSQQEPKKPKRVKIPVKVEANEEDWDFACIFDGTVWRVSVF